MQHLAVDQADLEALANGEVPEVLQAMARVALALDAKEAAHSAPPGPPAGDALCGASPLPRHFPPSTAGAGAGRGPTDRWYGDTYEGFEREDA